MKRSIITFCFLLLSNNLWSDPPPKAVSGDSGVPSAIPSVSKQPFNPGAKDEHEKVLHSKLSTFALMVEPNRIRPSLANWAGELLYFTEDTSKENCEGENLYSYSLETKKLDRIETLECVTGVLSNGKELFVHHLKDPTQWTQSELLKLTDGKLVPAFSEVIWSWHESKLQFAVDELGWKQAPDYRRYYFIQNDKLVILSHAQNEKGQIFFDQFSLANLDKENPNPELDFYEVKQLRVNTGVSDISLTSNGKTLYLLRKNMDTYFIDKLSLGEGEVSASFGGAQVNRRGWKESPASKWGVRNPRYLTALKDGFLISDRTTRVYESKAVSYFSAYDQKFYQLDFPSKDLSGVNLLQSGGILFSKPNSGKIVWMGDIGTAQPAWIKYGSQE